MPRFNHKFLAGNHWRFYVTETNELCLRAGRYRSRLSSWKRSIGPGLGADSVAAGETAAVIGLVLVAAYMVAVMDFGALADVALVANIV